MVPVLGLLIRASVVISHSSTSLQVTTDIRSCLVTPGQILSSANELHGCDHCNTKVHSYPPLTLILGKLAVCGHRLHLHEYPPTSPTSLNWARF
jgi:hypothetical protein